MSTSQATGAASAEGRQLGAASVGEILRLLSGGAAGEILLALRQGPTQTKVLTHQVKGYTARTIYRYLARLAELGTLDRNDDPGGPARVVHALTGDAGSELAELIDRFAAASMTRVRCGQIDSREWASLGLLADLWEAGVVEALSHGPTSPTELTRGLRCLSYHQLIRRASRFEASGFFREAPQLRRQRRCYALTRKARCTMGLVVGIGRWRHRHLPNDLDAGLTGAEMATVLRTLLPLAKVSRHPNEIISFHVEGSGEAGQLRVEREGEEAAWAMGTVEEWGGALLDGELCVATEGDSTLVRECLASLYEELWTPA